MRRPIFIRRVVLYTISLIFSVTVLADPEPEPFSHQFKIWGTLENKIEKLHFYLGFTNGLVVGAGAPLRSDENAGRILLDCYLKPSHPTADQAIAMIDKYYREHPEQWDTPVGAAIIQALMVKDGPCARN